MRILVAQPKHELNLEQLRTEIVEDVDAVLYPEGYILYDNVSAAHELARTYNKLLITGYRDQHGKDRALVISPKGETLLDRAKSPMEAELYAPSAFSYHDINCGYLLCVELLQGLRGLEHVAAETAGLDMIAHPIGVGMFSDEQLDEWVQEATAIARTYKAVIIGASHADGSYRNCGVSIPIAYAIDQTGEPIFLSKNDPRTVILDLSTREVLYLEPKLQ